MTSHPESQIVNNLDPSAIVRLVGEYRFGRYCEDPDLPLAASRQLMAEELKASLKDPAARCIQALAQTGELRGVLFFRYSKWDSDHFGFKVAVISSIIIDERQGYQEGARAAGSLLGCFDGWCKENSIRCVFAKIPALDLPVLHSLENSGFQYIESWIWNKVDLRKIALDTAPLAAVQPAPLRRAIPSDQPFMLDFVPGAFASHRFHADPRIPEDKKDSLYRKWIETAFAEGIQNIVVMEQDSLPVAFMITPITDLTRTFGLKFTTLRMALLDPAQRGKGLGEKFFISLFRHHKKEGVDIVDSGLTLRNLPSLNLHNKLRFKVVSTIVNFHRWY
ncbi:MAG: hypothetical protein HY748_00825 [Elusimicrobia bacterium]|nr:hypothetical protein [Elusimicrobiota bacterium]